MAIRGAWRLISSDSTDEEVLCDVPGCGNFADDWYPNLPDKLRHHWWPPGHVCPSEPWLCGDHSLSCCANVTCEAVITQQVRHPVRRNLPAGVVVPPCSLDYKSDPLELCCSCHNPGLVKHNEAVIEAQTATTCVCGELCRWRKQRGKAKPLK